MAIGSFRDQATEDINYGRISNAARRVLPVVLHEKGRLKLARLHAAESLRDLATLPGNPLKARKGQHSIRLNDKYRICFAWRNDAAENVEIVDYH